MPRELCRNARAKEFGRMIHQIFEDTDVVKRPGPSPE